MKLLDTDICIGLLKAVPKVVAAWRACDERCALSLMSVGELAYGAAKARDPEAERGRVVRLVGILDEGALTQAVMMRFGLLERIKKQCSPVHGRARPPGGPFFRSVFRAARRSAPTQNGYNNLENALKAELETSGTPLADADLLIAATALEHGMTLVTGNTKHFARIPGLQLENWF